MKSTVTTETLVSAVGGLAAGYLLWLVAISVGDALATVGVWSLVVLVLSGVLAILASLWGLWLRRRGKYLWSTFAFGLPILPVVLTLAVLADIYL